jgi:putative flippase GtrA
MKRFEQRTTRPRVDARLPIQALRYAIASFGGFAADYCTLLALKEWLGIHYLVAVPIAFVVGLAVNYLIGIWFVFQRGRLSLQKELILFAVISLLALAVTEGTMYALTDLMRIDYRISRLVSGAVTYLFNFFMRRVVLYRAPAKQ